MSAKKNLTGRTFGILTVEKQESDNRHGQSMWRCRCECGNVCVKRGYLLGNGRTTSCGCKRAESMRKVALKHGMAGTRTYRIWQAMMRRCYDTNFIANRRYGERGIVVDGAWHTFENFLEDMGPAPDNMTLERKNNSLGYSKNNCEWATRTRQTENRDITICVTYKGQKRSLSEWSRITNIPRGCLYKRLFILGWSVERAITSKPDSIRKPGVKRCRTEKEIARHRVHVEVRTGRLKRPDCCQHPGCSNETVQAHHHNGYGLEHQLDVVWLCPAHHPKPNEKLVEHQGRTMRLREWSEQTRIPLKTLRGRLVKSNWVVSDKTFAPVNPWKKRRPSGNPEGLRLG